MRSRSRTLLVVAGVATGALAAGVFAGMRITSPADAAADADPPAASDITVPVELRQLESEVITRGDVSYTGALSIEPQFPGLETQPVVTGQVPDVGDEVSAGDVVLEVVGRPIIALPGKVPMYRSLRPGLTGPDVAQLEKALDALGFDPGTVDDTYTASTGNAVAALFEEAGYQPPAVDQEIQAELDAAEDQVHAAEGEVNNAEAALAAASKEPSKAERLSAENEVNQAERALEQAKDGGDKAAIAQAEDELELAQARLDDLLEGPDTSAEQATLDAARDRLADAQAEYDAASAKAGIPLPASEVVFAPGLPRRVDEVNIDRGDAVDAAVMSISGTDLVVIANVDEAARDMLDADMEAVIDVPTGEQVTASITDITEATGDDASGYNVRITPDDLTNEQVEAVRSANVRVTIPVESTEGEVLAVPLAALTAGPSGAARIEVQRPGDDAEGPVSELMEVEVGLTAEGYAEIIPVEDGALAEGDLVVVGSEATAYDASTADHDTADDRDHDHNGDQDGDHNDDLDNNQDDGQDHSRDDDQDEEEGPDDADG